MKGRLTYLLLLLLMLRVPAIHSQTKVEVLTKSVTDNFKVPESWPLKVEGNAAQIIIEGENRDDVQLTMKLISKGLSRAIAAQELEYQQYIIEGHERSQIVRNYFLIPSSVKELSTIQETIIQLKVPYHTRLEISNNYGSIRVLNIYESVTINSEYGEIEVVDSDARITVDAHFGDVKLTDIEGRLRLDLSHVETTIYGYAGDAVIKSNLGNVKASAIGDIRAFHVIGKKADIEFSLNPVDQYSWVVESKYGSIEAPTELLENSPGPKIEYGDSSLPPVRLITDFGVITINK